MDFATIKKTLAKGGKYETYEDVFADVQLIWDNCKTYNMAGSDIYKLAEYMEKLAKRTIQKFRAQQGIPQIQQTPVTLPKRAAAVKAEGAAKRRQEEKSDGEEQEEEE